MNVLLLLDALKFSRFPYKDKSETLSSNMSAVLSSDSAKIVIILQIAQCRRSGLAELPLKRLSEA